jgi:hypothetical protein
MENLEVVEGNLKAVKGPVNSYGPNMWYLYVKDVHGFYEKVQWMGVERIQDFFTIKLPVF